MKLTNTDPRTAQILRYEELGLFKFLKAKFNDVPVIPERLLADNPRFPLLLLVPPLKNGLLAHTCKKGNINLYYSETRWRAFDARHADLDQWTWIRFQDGRPNRNKSVTECRKAFAKDELGLTALQGVCWYLQHSELIRPELILQFEDMMHLPGSVLDVDPKGSAALTDCGSEVRLDCNISVGASSWSGSASRWE